MLTSKGPAEQRPKKIKLFVNVPTLGFDDAAELEPSDSVILDNLILLSRQLLVLPARAQDASPHWYRLAARQRDLFAPEPLPALVDMLKSMVVVHVHLLQCCCSDLARETRDLAFAFCSNELFRVPLWSDVDARYRDFILNCAGESAAGVQKVIDQDGKVVLCAS